VYTGEGNFSFSLALSERLAASTILTVNVTATSFDSYEEVVKKYPESSSIVNKLSKTTNFEVMHGVDATDLSSSLCDRLFEEIWFNFPHLGREDLRSHIALVAHYFHSSLRHLATGGAICLALSEEQQRNWDM